MGERIQLYLELTNVFGPRGLSEHPRFLVYGHVQHSQKYSQGSASRQYAAVSTIALSRTP